MTTLTPTIRETAYKTLSKYTSSQLESKIKANLLVGISKEVAEEILTRRKSKEGIASVRPVENTTPIKSKEPKEKKEKKEIVLIDESDLKVKVILTNENFTKSDKIRELLELGYSVSQIAKANFPILNAHYSFVYSVFKQQKV